MNRPIETIRKAAALMRERAQDIAGYTSPWYMDWPEGGEDGYFVGYQTDNPFAGIVATVPDYGYGLAQHIAGWHPQVALAVADWLDDTAIAMVLVPDDYADARALMVARAFLEEAS